jgi:hypothetical protein
MGTYGLDGRHYLVFCEGILIKINHLNSLIVFLPCRFRFKPEKGHGLSFFLFPALAYSLTGFTVAGLETSRSI